MVFYSYNWFFFCNSTWGNNLRIDEIQHVNTPTYTMWVHLCEYKRKRPRRSHTKGDWRSIKENVSLTRNIWIFQRIMCGRTNSTVKDILPLIGQLVGGSEEEFHIYIYFCIYKYTFFFQQEQIHAILEKIF